MENYIFCGGDTIQKVWKLNSSNMSKVGESVDFGTSIYALTVLGSHIYCAGYYANTKIWKIAISDMSKVAESSPYSTIGWINALAADGVYIYAAGVSSAGEQKIWKIDPSDMSKIGESADFGGYLNALTVLGSHIYCAGYTGKVYKILLSDMSTIAESISTGGEIHALTNDGTYVYCGSDWTQKVWKIDPSNMSKVGETDLIYNIYALTSDDEYVYCSGGYGEGRIFKIRPSDMVIIEFSPDYGGIIQSLAFDGTFFYCGGSTIQKVWKLNANLEHIDTSIDYGGIIYALAYAEPVKLINIKAEPDSTQGAIKLYGEITEGGDITEKGFEYIIQDEEPSPEDTGIEVIKTKPAYQEYWEIGEYWAYEYEGNEVAFGDRLYRLSREEEYEHTTIWWFRAYFKIGEDKYTADSWMKNVPSVSTFACTEEGAQQATGNGELTDKGANTVERLGFRIIKEYSGDLMGAQYYCNILSGYKVAEELEETTLYDKDGIFIIGFTWTGIFYRDAFFPKSQTPGDFELGVYDYVLGGGFLGEELGVYLKPNDTYKIQAIAKNDLGIGYGDDIFEVTTGQNFLFEEDEPIISPTSVEKSVTIRDIPEGAVVTRVGIRLGRTTGCNEIDVFMDGEWGNGEKVTFYIPDLVPGKKYYEEPYMVLRYDDFEEEIIDDEEEEFEMEELEDEDLDDIIPTYEEYSYKTIIREIGCEKISDQSFIDKAGRRRSVTITNHLIQDRATCQEIIVDYLNKFQTIKLKVEIEYDIPIPFERQDSILIDDGVTSFKANGEGEILFKEDEEGESPMATTILAKIRKIDSNFISESESIFNLELEV